LNKYWEESVDNHGLDNDVANSRVPFWHVINKWSLEVVVEWSEVFFKVGIDKQDDNSSVKELSNKHAIRNLGEHFGVSVVANPGNKIDRQNGKDLVHDNKEDSN